MAGSSMYSYIFSPTQKKGVVVPSNLWIKLNFCPFVAIGTSLESSESCASAHMSIVFWGKLPAEQWRIKEIKSDFPPKESHFKFNTKTTAANIDYYVLRYHMNIYDMVITYIRY